MSAMGTGGPPVLLLFSEKDTKRLRQDSALCRMVVNGAIRVASLDPDLFFEFFPPQVTVYRPEITSDLPLSKATSQLVRRVLDTLAQQAVRDGMDELCSKLFLTMDNDLFTYYYKPLAVLSQRLQMTIAKFHPSQLMMFGGSHTKFHCPERPDLPFLLDRATFHRSAVQLLAPAYPIPIELISPENGLLVSVRRGLRNLVFQTARYSILSHRFLKSRIARRRWKAESVSLRGRPSIGVLIRGESELYSAQPVLSKLKSSGVQTIVLQDEILKDPSAEAVLHREKVEFVPLYSLISVAEFAGALRLASRFKRMLRHSIQRLPDVSTQEDELGSRVLARPDASQPILRAAVERMPETMVFFTALDNLMKALRPGVILSMSMVDHWGATSRMICDMHGTRMYTLQNAGMRAEHYPTPVIAHKLLLSDAELVDAFVKMGASSTQVASTGLPQYDRYIQMRTERERLQVIGGVRLSYSDKLVVITNSPYRLAPEKAMIKMLLQKLSGYREVFTVVKLHPRQDPRQFQDIEDFVRSGGYRALVASNLNVLELLASADLVVSRWSTTIMSAYLIGTPVVSLLDTEDRRRLLRYLYYPGIQRVGTLEELAVLVERALFDVLWSASFQTKRRAYLQNFPTATDGKATDRVVRHLLEAVGADGVK